MGQTAAFSVSAIGTPPFSYQWQSKPSGGAFADIPQAANSTYTTSILSPTGKVLWTQPEPAVEQSESFYPKRYISAQMALNLLAKTTPGEYTIAVTVKDGVGSQSVESKHTFSVE